MESREDPRPYLFEIAHRMLGSAAKAEDIVPETLLRYHETDVEAEPPRAHLATLRRGSRSSSPTWLTVSGHHRGSGANERGVVGG